MVDHAKARKRAIARFKEYVVHCELKRKVSWYCACCRPGNDQGLDD